MSVIGIILTFASIFAQYSLRPNVRVFGVPFLYAVLEFDQGRWRDFTGPLTLPALLGNGAVAFLIPQLIAATLRIARLR